MEFEVRRYRRTRASYSRLIDALGGKCWNCGKRFRPRLGVDHVDGRDYEPRELSWHQRVKRYWAEFKSGVRLRCACKECNGGYNPYRENQG